MPKRRVIFGILALGILAALIFALTHDRKPSYQGQPLSVWIQALGSAPNSTNLRSDAVAAVGHIGTKAVPYIVRWLQMKPSPCEAAITALARQLPEGAIPQGFLPAPQITLWRYDGAITALRTLGKEAEQALPELTRLLIQPVLLPIDETKAREVNGAAFGLAALGHSGLPALMAGATNHQAYTRRVALSAISSMGTNAWPALPLLLKRASSDPDEMAVSLALRGLGRVPFPPESVLPTLSSNLRAQSPIVRKVAALGLGRLDNHATSAVPALRNLLTDAVPAVRMAATNALLRIAPEALTNAPPK